jgi:hypothetical protein
LLRGANIDEWMYRHASLATLYTYANMVMAVLGWTCSSEKETVNCVCVCARACACTCEVTGKSQHENGDAALQTCEDFEDSSFILLIFRDMKFIYGFYRHHFCIILHE